MVLSIKEGLVECAPVCIKSVVILQYSKRLSNFANISYSFSTFQKIEETETNELVDYWAARPTSSMSEASPSPLKAKKLKKKKLKKISSESNQSELIESKNEASMSETSPSPLV